MTPAARNRLALAAAAISGALTVGGFAPSGVLPLPVFTLAGLFWLAWRAPRARDAVARGYAWGLAFFLCGVSWVYVSLHDFGQMPLAAAAFATLAFCGFLALYPAAGAWLAWRWRAHPWWLRSLGAAAAWTLTEWLRGWLLTGFPWLAAGYSQIPASALAGYAPVGGIHLVGFFLALTAGLLAAMPALALRGRLAAGAAMLAVWAGGAALSLIAWTVPEGEPLTVSLLQGNVAQDLKWRPERIAATLETYLALAEASRGRLVVMPETALPLFLHDVPALYLDRLRALGILRDGDVLVGVPERAGEGRSREYYNSVLSYGEAPTQSYRKDHLVPFGEFIPLRPLLGGVVSALAIPLQDFSRGGAGQKPLAVAGQRVAVDICYEDAFGEEIIRALPEASLLVNASNVAWFGHSIAPRQHLQISQARALETGRYLLRATNTGMTAIVDPRGRVIGAAPQFERAIVEGRVRGYAGATPYVRAGNLPVILLAFALAGACTLARRKTPP